MADGEVKIDTKLDTSGIDKGLKSVEKKVNKTTKDLNKGTKAVKGLKTVFNETGGAASSFATQMGSVASSGGAVAAGITAAILAAKKYIETLKQANEAYKVQEKAEKALAKAAENNPYLNRESLQNLKDYASELQSVSNFGDEGTIDVMAQLAASGRSESEIMKLVAAAADYAAAKHISLESAVQNLNKSYGGLAGELGELFPEVKALTAEQLKNGEAVDIIAQKYKGFAAEAADGGTQTKNAFGDFMESLGRIANPVFEALDKKAKAFWESMINHMDGFNNALQKARETWVIGGDYQWSKGFVKNINENLKSVQPDKKPVYLEDNAESLTDDNLKHLTVYLEAQKKLNDNERQFLEILKSEKTHRENRAEAAKKYTGYIEKWRNASKEELQTRQKTLLTTEYNTQELKAVNDLLKENEKRELKNQKEQQKAADDYVKANEQALQDSLKALEIEAQAKGKSVSAQDVYNASLQSYIDLLTKANGLVTEDNEAVKDRLNKLQELAKAAKTATDEETKLANVKKMQEESIALLKDIDGGKNKTAFDEYEEKNKQLDDWKNKVDLYEKDGVLSAQEAADAKLEIERQYWQGKKDLAEKVTTEINGYTQQTADIAKEAGDLMLENVQSQTNTELMELEKKYEAGEMSEEEYYDKQKQIRQKAAREEYKIKMFQWTASMLAATANIAEGVSKAIAQGGVAGIVTGALVAAAGGVQIASIIASKPTPPNFYNGGVIGGTNGATMGGDNTYIHARMGEMVLNAAQQRSLWDRINGQGGRGETSMNLTVNNTQSNKVDTQFREEDGAVFLDIVDKRVNKGFVDGTFDGGYASMLTRQEGERIL